MMIKNSVKYNYIFYTKLIMDKTRNVLIVYVEWCKSWFSCTQCQTMQKAAIEAT